VGKIAKLGLTSELVVIHIGDLWYVTRETSGCTNILKLRNLLEKMLYARSLQMLQTPAQCSYISSYLLRKISKGLSFVSSSKETLQVSPNMFQVQQEAIMSK
jgi:hypothetical protein